MGGNVRVMDVNGQEVGATKIDLMQVDRSKLCSDIKRLLQHINMGFGVMFHAAVWEDESVIHDGSIFNGSGESLFNASIPDAEFIAVKRWVGDIDIVVPVCHKLKVWTYLQAMQGKFITPDIMYIGNNRPNYQEHSAQINALFRYQDINVQIDFEFLPYDEHNIRPLTFSKFSHSSAWIDMKAGIKGVHHKYLMRALAGGASLRRDVQVITRKTGKPQANPDGVTFNKFSVDRGLRVGAYVAVIQDGEQLMVNGLPAFHEVPTSQSEYITDVCLIGQHMLGAELSCEDVVEHMNSFTGIIHLMKKYSSESQIVATLDRMNDLYWSKGAQGFERNDPAADLLIKMSGWNMLMKEFPFYVGDVGMKKDKYYQDYRLTKQEDT